MSNPHAKSEGAKSQDQIAPAHVLLFTAVFCTCAAVGWNIGPGKQTRDKLANGPPDAQHGQHVARNAGQEFKEESAIDGQIPTNTKTKASVQSRDPRFVISGKILVIFRNGTYPIQVGPPPAARPKAAAKNKVVLNARRRPTISDATPQKEAPIQRPKKKSTGAESYIRF